MPIQTQKKSKVFFPDGAVVALKGKGDLDWYDVGAINSSVTATLNWTESTIETANAGKLDTRISNMEMAGGFTLINLDPEGVARLSAGAFKLVKRTSDPITEGFKVEIIDKVAADDEIELEPEDADGKIMIDRDSTPAFTINKDYVDEENTGTALVEDTDYKVEQDENGVFFVLFKTANENVAVLYTNIVPRAAATVHGGSSTKVLESCAMRITHTDENGRIRRLELHSVSTGSGSFQFNFRGANEDGIEEMPLSYTAKLDSSKTDKMQLFAWTIEEDAL